MLGSSNIIIRQAFASAAMTAFQVSEVQQQRFERTFAEVKNRNRELSERQRAAAEASERRVEEQRKAAEARRVARSSETNKVEKTTVNLPEAPQSGQSSSEAPGGLVDLEV